MAYGGTLGGLSQLLQEKIYKRSPEYSIQQQKYKDMFEEALRRKGVRNIMSTSDLTSEEGIIDALKRLSTTSPEYFTPLANMIVANRKEEEVKSRSQVLADFLQQRAAGGINPAEQAEVAAESTRQQLTQPELWNNEPRRSISEYRGQPRSTGKTKEQQANELGVNLLKMGYTNEQAARGVKTFLDTGVFDPAVVDLPGQKIAVKYAIDKLENEIKAHPAFKQALRRTKVGVDFLKKDIPVDEALAEMLQEGAVVPSELKDLISQRNALMRKQETLEATMTEQPAQPQTEEELIDIGW